MARPLSVLPGPDGIYGAITNDVPYAFRSDLSEEGRASLALSDSLKEAASKSTLRDMVACFVEPARKARELGPAGRSQLDRIDGVLRQIERSGNAGIARAGLRARAFEIDSEHVFVVRNPNRLAMRPLTIDMTRESEVEKVLKDRGVRTGSGVVSFAATKADIQDARAILEGERFTGGARPSGLNSSRLAFFIAANVTALHGDHGLSGRQALDLMASDSTKMVQFRIDALGRSAARAMNAEAWMANLGKVHEESRARVHERIRGPEKDAGLGR